jgi:hypothetical protein
MVRDPHHLDPGKVGRVPLQMMIHPDVGQPAVGRQDLILFVLQHIIFPFTRLTDQGCCDTTNHYNTYAKRNVRKVKNNVTRLNPPSSLDIGISVTRAREEFNKCILSMKIDLTSCKSVIKSAGS